MSAGALPHIVDFRGLASRGARVAGVVALEKLQRLSAAVVGAQGPAEVDIQFDRDEMGRHVATLKVSMQVEVECQRCLEPMPVTLEGNSRIAALWSESQIAELPEDVDPLITGEETDLWLMVEEELLLSLPPYPLHENANCATRAGRAMPESGQIADTAEPVRENPFAVLKALRNKSTENEP
jgi:uncharacterized protein